MADHPEKSWFKTIGSEVIFAGRVLTTIIATFAVLSSIGSFLFAEPLQRVVGKWNEALKRGTVCSSVPSTGHEIDDVAPGRWGDVTWVGIEKFRDCGKPVISAMISNGGNFLHDAETSISGINLPVGSSAPLSYRFLVPVGTHIGPAKLQVTVAYPDAPGGAPVTISPWVPFNIVPNGALDTHE